MERQTSQKLNLKSSNNIFQISNKTRLFFRLLLLHIIKQQYQTVDHLFEKEGGNTIPNLHSHFWFLVKNAMWKIQQSQWGTLLETKNKHSKTIFREDNHLSKEKLYFIISAIKLSTGGLSPFLYNVSCAELNTKALIGR